MLPAKGFSGSLSIPQYGIVTANELVFPASKAVRVNLRTEDVIHSFGFAKLAGKWISCRVRKTSCGLLLTKTKSVPELTPMVTPTQKMLKQPCLQFLTVKRDKPSLQNKHLLMNSKLSVVFYGQCAEYCGNSHAYMSFRALAQTDEDFDKWVLKFRNAQKPESSTNLYVPENEYAEGDIVTFSDSKLGENVNREFRAVKSAAKGQNPDTKPDVWEKAHSDDYEKGKMLFSLLQCVQCHAPTGTGLGAKGPNLTLFGLLWTSGRGLMRKMKKVLINGYAIPVRY